VSVTEDASRSAALAEPVVPVRRSWIGLLFAANLGLWMAFFTPVQILLPNQIAAIDATAKEDALGWVTGLGALVAIVVCPLAGALSDRSRPYLLGRRYGRRHPWTLAGIVLSALSLAALANQHTIVGVALGWAGAQIGLNVMLATLTAAVPDRVPVRQRGLVSGWIGMPQALGLVVGAVLVTTVATGVPGGYLAMTAVLVVLTVWFPLLTPDDPLTPEVPLTLGDPLTPDDPLPPAAATPAAGTPPAGTPAAGTPPAEVTPAGIPGRAPRGESVWRTFRDHPDFAWAWGTRFLVQLGNAMGTLYLLYFLTDKVRVKDPEGSLLVLILLYTLGMVATAVVGGRLSDISGRRKIFVIWSSVVITVAAALLAVRPTWPASIVAAVLLGAGYGIYLAVDTALVTQVLPTAVDRAKDLGVINIATAAPQVLGPALAAPLVTHLGGYPVLYLVTALVTLLGGVMVVRIKSVP
jgi:MFS family permease